MGGSVLLYVALIGMLLAPLWLYLELRALHEWRGWWRAVAVFPAAVVAGHAAFIVAGMLHTPTSHDLWPLELGLTLAPALVVIALATAIRRRAIT